MPPVTLGVEVAEPQLAGPPGQDGSDAAGDLAGHEVFAASGRLVVEEDAAAGEHLVRLAVVDGHPVRVELGDPVGTAWMKRCLLVLRRRRQAEHFGGGRLVEPGGAAGSTNRLQQPGGAQPVGVSGVLRLVEGDVDLALGRQVVDLVRLDGHHQPVEAARVRHVTVVEREAHAFEVRWMGVLEVVDAAAVHGRGAAHHPVNLVALVQQQLRQVGPVLAGDPGDQGALCHGHSVTTVRGTRSCPTA